MSSMLHATEKDNAAWVCVTVLLKF